MPELPEVEGARRLFERTAVGKRITLAVVAEDDKVIQGVTSDELRQALEGRTILAAKRLGKHLWLELSNGGAKCPALLLHFGMTGGLAVKGIGAAHYKSFSIDATQWPPRFWKIDLELSDGTQLAFCDSRRFARVRLMEDPLSQPPLSELGWDPLLSWPSLEDFMAALAKQRRALKAVLLDQSFSAGVGNWVADEVLYQAHIHPEQPANSLTPEQAKALHGLIVEVCRTASEVEADAERLPKDWLFHVRWGKGSKEVAKIGGHAIQHITVGGRTSAFVPALQKLSKAAAAAAAAKAAAPNKASRGEKGAPKSRKKEGQGAAREAAGAGEAAAEGAGEAMAGAEEGAAAAAPAGAKAKRRAGGQAAAGSSKGEEGAPAEPAAGKEPAGAAAAQAGTMKGAGPKTGAARQRAAAPARSQAAAAAAAAASTAAAATGAAATEELGASGEPAEPAVAAPAAAAKGRGGKGARQSAAAGTMGAKRGRSGSIAAAAVAGEEAEGGQGRGRFHSKRAKR